MVYAEEFKKALGLEELAPCASGELTIENSELNRPGMELAGFWEYFAWERPQLFGKVEMAYLGQMEPDVKRERLTKLMSYAIPCIIICHRMQCDEMLLEMARKNAIPVYVSQKATTQVVLEMITWLNDQLAPRETRHGVLVDVYGVGVMITGESGVGKSEAALELVKRGHRLVADDVVDIRRVDSTLIGEAPEMIRHLMEIRGVGIIDVYTMYGVSSVIREKSIDMEVHMELWQDGHAYDRLGLDERSTQILGVSIPSLLLPIHPGRNIAIVLEVAARNLRLKQMGYSAADELLRRQTGIVTRPIGTRENDDEAN